MRPQRHVRRSATRPSYTRNSPSRVPRRPQRKRSGGFKLALPNLNLPAIQTSWIRWAALSVLVLGILVVVAQATKLNKVEVQGNKNLTSIHITQLAEEATTKQWFGRNTVLLNTGAIGSYLEEQEPAIKQAKVRRSGLQGVKISVTERQPSLNWKSNNSVYLLDTDGTVIGPSVGEYIKLPTVIDSTNLPVKEGSRVAPASFVAFCVGFIARLPEAGLVAESITVPETTSELTIKTTKGYSIKLDTTRSIESTVTALKTVQAELTRSKKTPKEYIDLRIESKAYYK